MGQTRPVGGASGGRQGWRARVVALAVGVLVLAGCPAAVQRGGVGKPAPPLEGPSIVEGERVDLAKLGGRVTLVNFWGSWCDPCRRELPRLVEAQRAGTAVVGVAVEDSRRRARAMLAEYQATWPSADDPDRRIARSWGVGGGFPVTFAIDATGIVRGSRIGEMSADDITKLIASASAGPRGP